MASAAAVLHRKRAAKAFAAMESIGVSRQTVTPILQSLLKIYDNEWDFIEAENYRALADSYFDQLDSQKNKRPEAAAPAADYADDSFLPPLPGSPPPAAARVTACDLTIVKTEPPEEGRRQQQPQQRNHSPAPSTSAVAINVAQAVEYHSGDSARARALAGQSASPSPSQQGRPRTNGVAGADHNAAALDQERRKAPLGPASNGSPARRPQPPQSQKPPAPSPRPEPGLARPLVKVKVEVDPSVPTPQGFDPVPFETVHFQRVGGVIVPAVVGAREDDDNGRRPDRNPPHSNVCGPAPLLAVDPATGRFLELQEQADRPVPCQDNGGQLEPEMSPDLAAPAFASPVDDRASPGDAPVSTSLEIVPYGAVDFLKRTPSPDELSSHIASLVAAAAPPPVGLPSDMDLEEPGGFELPSDQALGAAVEEDGRDPLFSLVPEYNQPEFIHRPDAAEQSPPGSCDFVLMPDAPSLEPSLSPDPNGEEIRPNFILAGPSKRAAAEAQDGIQRKRQRREREAAAVAPSSRAQHDALVVQEGAPPGEEDLNDGHIEREAKHSPLDISRGSERIPIPFVNEFTSEAISDSFTYIASNVVYQDAYINISLARIGDEDYCSECTGNCLNAPFGCPCTRETGGEFAYTPEGLLKPEYIKYAVDMTQDLEVKMKCVTYCSWDCPIERAKNENDPDKCKGHYVRKFVKECWHKCGCGMHCGNRVVQRGIDRRLQVFFTNDGKGWGIRTAEDLPAGAFVCEYVGEILTNMELDQRNQENRRRRKSSNEKNTYPLLLDGDWCSERGLKDEEALCLDATKHGNVARFINHRCWDANLIDIPVSIDSQDRHYYHVAFFTCRDIKAGEELTWDYKIDFDDDEHPIDAFPCLCGSEFCRGAGAAPVKKKARK